MTIKRKRLSRQPLSSGHSRVTELTPGLTFTLSFDNGDIVKFEFETLAHGSRKNLAIDFRDAIWSMRHSAAAASLQSYMWAIKTFWRFLDESETSSGHTENLYQIDSETVLKFLTWLSLQIVPYGYRNAGKPLSTAHKRTIYNGIKALLINRQRLAPNTVSPLLAFPSNPFSNIAKAVGRREPYSKNEQQVLLEAVNRDLRQFHTTGTACLTQLQVLVVHLIAFGLTTGLNLQPLLELRRDSLKPHPLPDREVLVTFKRRGWTTHSISTKLIEEAPPATEKISAVPKSVSGHFRALCSFTEHLVDSVDVNLSAYLFLYTVSRGNKKNEVHRLTPRAAKAGLAAFVRRHALKDSAGKKIELCFARLRPTFATELYERTKDIRAVSAALGHASTETTSRYYVSPSIDGYRDYAMVLDAMYSSYTQVRTSKGVILAADGSIPADKIEGLLKSGYSTGIAHCRNPFRDDDDVCKKFFACFSCPNMLVFEDDLWRLFSFYEKILSERGKLKHDHWMRTYAPIVRRIDSDISPLFPANKVEEARRRAKQNPHPAWR